MSQSLTLFQWLANGFIHIIRTNVDMYVVVEEGCWIFGITIKWSDNTMSMSKLWYRNNRSCTAVLGTVHRAEMIRPGSESVQPGTETLSDQPSQSAVMNLWHLMCVTCHEKMSLIIYDLWFIVRASPKFCAGNSFTVSLWTDPLFLNYYCVMCDAQWHLWHTSELGEISWPYQSEPCHAGQTLHITWDKTQNMYIYFLNWCKNYQVES